MQRRKNFPDAAAVVDIVEGKQVVKFLARERPLDDVALLHVLRANDHGHVLLLLE